MNNNIILNSNKLKVLSPEDIKSKYISKTSTFIKEDKTYYFKTLENNSRILNELIGTYLSNILGVSSIKYDFGVIKSSLITKPVLLSEDFKDKNRSYFYLYNLPFYCEKSYELLTISNFENLLKYMTDNDNDFNRLNTNLFKMFLIDIYSHQVDRHDRNIMFIQNNKHNYELAPLYDFEDSFDVSFNSLFSFYNNINFITTGLYIYGSDILSIAFPSKELKDFFNKYPYLYDEYLKILDIDINKILFSIERDYHTEIPKDLKNKYSIYGEKENKFLRLLK